MSLRDILNGFTSAASNVGNAVSRTAGDVINTITPPARDFLSYVGQSAVNAAQRPFVQAGYNQQQGIRTTPIQNAALFTGRAQQFVESPQSVQPIPQITPFRGTDFLSQAGNFAANIPSGIINGMISPALNLGMDVGQSIGRDISGRPRTSYENLKSPISRLGYNIAGQNRTPQQIIGNLTGTGADIMSSYLPIGAGAIAEGAVRQGLRSAIKEGAFSAGKYMGVQGGLQGLSEGRNQDIPGQVISGAQGAAQGIVTGALTGGLLGGGAHLLGAIKGAFPKSSPEMQKQAATKYARDIQTGRFKSSNDTGKTKADLQNWVRQRVGKGPNEPVYHSDLVKAAQGGFIKPDEFLPKGIKNQVANTGVPRAEIKKVADNLEKYNPGLGRTNAEAMAKDIISNRPFNKPLSQQPIQDINSTISTQNIESQVPATPIGGASSNLLSKSQPALRQELSPTQKEQGLTKTIAGTPPESQQGLLRTDAGGTGGRDSSNGIIPPSGINAQHGDGNSIDSTLNQYHFNKIDKIYTETLDRFHPLSRLGRTAGEDQAMRNALTGYYGSGSTGKYHIDHELSPILKSVPINDLRQAAIALRDAELKQRGIQGSNTSALDDLLKSGQLGDSAHSQQIGEALKKLYAYQDNLVKEYLVNTGIMSKDSYQAMKKNNQFYVPFKRVMDNVDEWLGGTPQTKGAGSVGSQNVIKGIKGSERDIHDPLESIIENTYKLVGLGKRQEVAKTIISLKDKLPEGTIKKFTGVTIGNSPTVSVFENGKVQKYLVPREVSDAAKGLNEDQMSTIVKILAAPTRVFRATATGVNPEFLLPNTARDLQSAFVNIGLNPLKFVSGLAHYMKKDAVYQEFLKSGGMTSRISLDRKYLKTSIDEIGSKSGINIKKPSDVYHLLEKFGQYSEQPTRIAAFQQEYNKALKSGLGIVEARARGAYAAQEATVNFARRGAKTQSINSIYAFMNARAQGVDRLIRSIKADPAGVGIRIGMITAAPAIALYAHNRRFQSYNDERIISKYDKQNNFIIMLSNTPIDALGGAQYIKIPKGDVGKMANPLEAFMAYADTGSGDVKNALQSVLQGFSPVSNMGDIIPTALRPIVETKANYDFFRDRPIVSQATKDKAMTPSEQANSSTPAIYRKLGELTGQSPLQMEHIASGYLTGFEKIGAPIASNLLAGDQKQAVVKGEGINRTPVVRRFLGGAKRSVEEQQAVDYYKYRDDAMKGMSTKEKAAFDSIPSYEPGDPQGKLYKYNALLQYPSVYVAKKAIAIEQAKGDMRNVDPLYSFPYEQVKRYLRYEAQNPGSRDKKDLYKAYPEIGQIGAARSAFFQTHPMGTQEQGGNQSSPPRPSAYVQEQMNAKNWKDPQVRAYLDANMAYNNQQRELLGLTPLAGFSSYAKKPKKIRIGKIKKVRMPKIATAKFKMPMPISSVTSYKIKPFRKKSSGKLPYFKIV